MKIGFLLPHFGPNQLAFHLISSANAFLDKQTGVDIVAFLSNQVRPWQNPNFASMNINEAFDFDGVVVATTLHTAEKILRFPGPSRRYFYIWDLEWVRTSPVWKFEELLSIYCDPGLTLIARNDEHKEIIEKCWNCKVKYVIPNCDVAAFVEMVRKDVKN